MDSSTKDDGHAGKDGGAHGAEVGGSGPVNEKGRRQRQREHGGRSSMFEACVGNDMHARTAAPPRKDGGGGGGRDGAGREGRKGGSLPCHRRPKLRRSKGGMLSGDEDADAALHATSSIGRPPLSSYPPPQSLRRC
eukprot:109009-Pelagomonas_calceolata.AAC.1